MQIRVHAANTLTGSPSEQTGWLRDDPRLQQARSRRLDIEVIAGHRTSLVDNAAMAVYHIKVRRLGQPRTHSVQRSRHEYVIGIQPTKPVAWHVLPAFNNRIRLPAIGSVTTIG